MIWPLPFFIEGAVAWSQGVATSANAHEQARMRTNTETPYGWGFLLLLPLTAVLLPRVYSRSFAEKSLSASLFIVFCFS